MVSGPEESHARPAPRRRQPRWVTVLLAVLAIGSGAFRLLLGASLFDRVFGVVLLVLGASFVRELLRDRATDAGPG